MNLQSSGKGKSVPTLLNKNLILAIIFLAAFFTSCKKEMVAANEETLSASQLSAEDAVAKPTTNFGTLISGTTNIDDEIKICQQLGVIYVRYAIFLEDFNGVDKGYEKWVNAGYKVLLNLNYGHINDSKGGRNPVPFPTDMNEYKRLLQSVLSKYHPEVAVIENEPTTDAFHTGPIENYITELKTAVSVCNKFGVAVADGGIHVDYLPKIINGWPLDGNTLETKKIIDAVATMNITYINTHSKGPFYGNPNVYPTGTLEGYADYLRTATGKPVMCNEYNQKNNSTTLLTGVVDGFRNGGFKYAIVRSGSSGNDGAALNKGTNLTPLGVAYRNAIR